MHRHAWAGQAIDAAGLHLLWLGLMAGGLCFPSAAFALPGTPEAGVKLLPPEGGIRGWFGGDVALKSTTLVVGAEWRHARVRGRGSATVFEYAGGQWQLTADLPAVGNQGAGRFGAAVATDGETIVVGDPDFSSPGPSGSVRSSGAAYVYEKSAFGWELVQSLTPGGLGVDRRFGGQVAVSGSTALVAGGGVHVYEKGAGGWVAQATLAPSIADGYGLGGGFGGGMVLHGDVALIGASSFDSGSLVNSGAVFAYERDGFGWRETGVLRPSDPVFRGSFGYALDFRGDTAIIGRPAGGSAAVGPFQGAAYIFQKVGEKWVESAKLLASDGFLNDGFGSNVAISGDVAAVLATNRDQSRIYLFGKRGEQWQEIGRIDDDVPFSVDQFGIAMDMDGGRLAVGARLDDQADQQAGAAYVLTVPEPRGRVIGAACALAATGFRWRRGGRGGLARYGFLKGATRVGDRQTGRRFRRGS
ncbi:MAG: hypothetical protein IT424_03210 [Pirellulales bacterium]|nr:hypothetical protein [Pirellulales bacterium]